MSSPSKPDPEPQQLVDVLESRGIKYDEYDLFLFGDGSGLTWEIGGGFATFIVDRNKQLRKHMIGARTLSTVNRMELSAYTEALSYHYECVMDRKIQKPPYKVVVLTDSELTERVGNGVYSRKANGDLWQVIDWFTTRGYRIRWVWVPRNSTPYHELADYLAGAARRALIELRLGDEELYRCLPVGSGAIPAGDGDPVGSDRPVCRDCGTPLSGGATACDICGARTGGAGATGAVRCETDAEEEA
jgi:ribonuclease HI